MSKYITLNGETYKRIDDLDEEKPSLKPEEGEEFFLISSNGDIVSSKFQKGNTPYEGTYETGNIYKTREEAEKKLEELKAIQRVKEYIVENFGYHPEKWMDWSWKDKKWEIVWEEKNKDFDCSFVTDRKYYYPFGVLKTEEQAKQLIEDKKEDLETIYKPK